MSHGRHDYPEALHLLRVRGREGSSILFSPDVLREDVANLRESTLRGLNYWESLVARVCDRYVARVHGYAWLPNEAFLLLQRHAVPLRIILASLLGPYSRYLHKCGRVPRQVSPYLCRCDSIEVTPELVPYALRNVYSRPVSAGLCTNVLVYPFCSSRFHFAEGVPTWFETKEFLAAVRKRGHVGRQSVEQFLTKAEARRHAKLFERLSSRVPQIAGEQPDIDDSMVVAQQCPRPPSVQQIEDAVSTILLRESKSTERVLAAALTTWYATRAGAATLAQMGRWFHREPTTLRADIESHRRANAPLFEMSNEEFQSAMRSNSAIIKTCHGAHHPDVPGPSGISRPVSTNRLGATHRSRRPR